MNEVEKLPGKWRDRSRDANYCAIDFDESKRCADELEAAIKADHAALHQSRDPLPLGVIADVPNPHLATATFDTREFVLVPLLSGGDGRVSNAGDGLLPCPFCGSESIDANGWASQSSSGPACDDCGASAGCVSDNHADNVAAWNRRLASPPSGDVPEGCVLVPREPTPEIVAAAAVAIWPHAGAADMAIARKAALIVLQSMDAAAGVTLEMVAASIATMPAAYRAMLAASTTSDSGGLGREGDK